LEITEAVFFSQDRRASWCPLTNIKTLKGLQTEQELKLNYN